MGLVDRFDRVEELVDRIIENEERYRIFLDSSPWGILVVDQTFYIAYVNETFERMSGWKFSELAGRHLRTLLPKEHHKIHGKHEASFIKNPHHRIGNHGLRPQLLRKDGTLVDVEISLSPTRIHGQEFYFASVRTIDSLYNTLPANQIDHP